MACHPPQNVLRVCVTTHPPRDFLDLGRRHPIDPGNLPHRGACPKAHVIGNRSQAFSPVILPQFLMECVAFIPGKIHVDIGRIFSLGVEKAAKKEVVTNGVHMGDPQEIAYQARGGAASAAVNGPPPYDIGHHQEVVHVTFGMNQGQFFFKTPFEDGVALSVTPGDSLAAFVPKEGEMVLGLVGIVRENRREMIPGGVAAFGQLHRIGKGFGGIRKMSGHHFGRFQPLAGLDDRFRRQGAQGAVERNGPHQTVQGVIFRVGKIDRVGRYGRDAQAPGQLQRLAAGGPGHHLDPAFGAGTQALDEVRMGAEYRKMLPGFGEVSEEGEFLVEVTPSEQFGEQLVPFGSFCQDDDGREA